MKKKSEEQVTKKCSKCEVVKPLDEFTKCSGNRTGFQSYCAECANALSRRRYEKNKGNEQEKARQRYWDNREDRLEFARKYREAHPEKAAAATKNWQDNNKEHIREYRKQYTSDRKAERSEYLKNRYKSDKLYRLSCVVKASIYRALKSSEGSKEGNSTLDMLPYTLSQLKEHLENQFEPWMNWDNQGEWHIDHIYPQSKLPYDSMTHPNFLKCWALENLQPLEASENQSKGNRLYEREAA